ncbi:MAG TPA: hypothetical protein GXX55_11935 [Firmicutes bacterium]|nr:hypothetical protein [Bacillota bacterium]
MRLEPEPAASTEAELQPELRPGVELQAGPEPQPAAGALFEDSGGSAGRRVLLGLGPAVAASTVVVLLLGVYPQPFIDWARQVAVLL